jgi:RNA polymerase-binding transcription factor DksA
MAKKAQKGKPAKKAAKPAKKVVAKKAAPKKAAKPAKKVVAKKPVKKAAPKKVAKAVKKAVAKKPVKKVVAKKAVAKKPVKKIVAKPVKKAVAKKPVKKVIAKKAVKVAKKVVAKKEVKKVVAKKAPAKPIQKVVLKPVAKVEAKKIIPAKPIVIAKPITPVAKKPEPVLKKKVERDLDTDDDNRDQDSLVVEYKVPSIRRPMGPIPKPHINTDKRTRYTDAELKEFKELILKKLSEAQKDYELLKSTLSHKDDHGTDDTSPTFKLLEDGSDVLSKEETSHLAGRQEKFIQNLQNALIRIENKTYGICRVTGKLISKERLRSVPHATLVIEAKLGQNA